MKNFFFRFSSSLLAFVVLMSFLGFSDSIRGLQLVQSLDNYLFASGVLHTVSAQQLNGLLTNPEQWQPVSRKHKGLDGGWTMPFEMYQQRYVRNNSGGGGYDNLPVSIDLNGDGLLDWVYSYVNSSLYPTGSAAGYFSYQGPLTQYIVLRRSNGFELAYRCYQKVIDVNVGSYEYRGDCADTSYQGGDAKQEVMWSPSLLFYLDSPNWTNSKPFSTSVEKLGEIGVGSSIFDIVYNQASLNGNQILGDRQIPKFMDINGDGLPDVVFTGATEVGLQTASHPSTPLIHDMPFILLNSGKGFEKYAACLTVQPGYPLKNYFNIPSNQLPKCY